MNMKESKDLLESILKTTQMGQIGIRSALDTSAGPELCKAMESQLKEYDSIETQAQELAKSKDWKLKELDLSCFDTRNVTVEMRSSFSGLVGLEKLALGENVKFDGNGSLTENQQVVLPAPAAKTGHTAKWRNVETGELFLASEIPEKTAATYEAYYEPIS